MPIDTSILSGLKPLQIESPLNQLGKMYELQNAQQANQLGALNMQEARRSMGANEQLRQLYGEQGINQDSPEFLRRLGAISPEARRAQMKFMQEQALSQSTITRNTAQAASAGLTGQKAQLDRAKILTDMGVSILGGATDEDSYKRSLAQLKIIGGDTSQLPTSYDKTRVQEFINKGLSHKDQLAAQDRALDEQIAKQFTTAAVAPLGTVDRMLPPEMQTGVTSPGAPASMDFAAMARAKLAARPGDPQALALLQATQPKYSYQNLQNKTVPVQTNALAPGFTPPQPMAMGMSPSAAEQLKVSQGQLGVSQGQLGVSQGQLNLGRDRLAYERANPGYTLHTDDSGAVVGVNTKTLQSFPVNVGASGGVPLMGPRKDLTESQGAATGYGMRMNESHNLLKDLENKGVANTGRISGAVGGVLGLTPFIGDKLEGASGSVFNVLPGILAGLSPDQQRVQQARINFITAVLRKESGASISPSEFITAEKMYFPRPGDDKTNIEQKQRTRETAIRTMEVQAGSGAKNIRGPASDPLGIR
jgi:hypothetical protein